MSKIFSSVALLLLFFSFSEGFFPGFPFPPGVNFPHEMFPRIPGTIWRPQQRPRPRPRPDNRETCPDEGVKLISHPTDCEQYILCIEGDEVTTLTCPGGLHFSRETRSCVDPRIAGCDANFEFSCPAQDDPNNVVFLPDVTDCSRYYLCWSGTPIPMTCAGGLHWSIAGSACVDPAEANCAFSAPFNQPISPASQAEVPPQSLPEILPQSVPEVPLPQPAAEVPKAISKRSIRQRDEKATSYNPCPNTGISSVPNPASCEGFFLCVNGIPLERDCPAGQHFSPTLRNCAPPEIAQCTLSECPPTGLHFLPHEDDCTKYYICFNGMQNLMTCPNELHWSVDNNRCMDPDEAGCEDGDGIYECPPTGIEQIPNPDDCESFILCINGVELPLSCAPGLHFSPTERQCMSPEDAGCEDKIWECPAEDTPGVIVFIPNTEDCTMYYLCWQGNQIPLRCPTGLHWSINENRCLPPDEAECPFDDDEADKCPDEGIVAIPHPDTCHQYILCVNGHEVERDCPHGLHFSRDLGNCAHPAIANCIRAATKFSIPENDESCPAISSTHELAIMPNRHDCSSYYVCIKNDSRLFSCAAGLHFDINRNKCMFINQAQCIIQ